VRAREERKGPYKFGSLCQYSTEEREEGGGLNSEMGNAQSPATDQRYITASRYQPRLQFSFISDLLCVVVHLQFGKRTNFAIFKTIVRAFSKEELGDLRSLFVSLASQSQSDGKFISQSVFQVHLSFSLSLSLHSPTHTQ
jgi:hypothetical protein